MEIHAHVPKMGKTGVHWLLEAILIVACVGLGSPWLAITSSQGMTNR